MAPAKKPLKTETSGTYITQVTMNDEYLYIGLGGVQKY